MFVYRRTMSILTIHRFEGSQNIGDIVSSPCDYFDYEATHYDVRRVGNEPLPVADVYLCGGGAITRSLTDLPPNKIKIGWGIGQSLRPAPATATTTPLTDFDLVGSRDIGIAGTEWVPCVSCMSPLFDEEYEIEHEVVSYMNALKYSHPDMPYATNRGTFEEAITFIGSSKVVITNSYHGAYWATLLGRAAVIVNPYNSKFYQYKHQPAMEGETPRAYPDALAECREANIEFNDKVKQVVP